MCYGQSQIAHGWIERGRSRGRTTAGRGNRDSIAARTCVGQRLRGGTTGRPVVVHRPACSGDHRFQAAVVLPAGRIRRCDRHTQHADLLRGGADSAAGIAGGERYGIGAWRGVGMRSVFLCGSVAGRSGIPEIPSEHLWAGRGGIAEIRAWG